MSVVTEEPSTSFPMSDMSLPSCKRMVAINMSDLHKSMKNKEEHHRQEEDCEGVMKANLPRHAEETEQVMERYRAFSMKTPQISNSLQIASKSISRLNFFADTTT